MHFLMLVVCIVLKMFFARSDSHCTLIVMAFHVLHQNFIFGGMTYQRYEHRSGERNNSDNLELCIYLSMYMCILHVSPIEMQLPWLGIELAC